MWVWCAGWVPRTTTNEIPGTQINEINTFRRAPNRCDLKTLTFQICVFCTHFVYKIHKYLCIFRKSVLLGVLHYYCSRTK